MKDYWKFYGMALAPLFRKQSLKSENECDNPSVIFKSKTYIKLTTPSTYTKKAKLKTQDFYSSYGKFTFQLRILLH